MSVFEASRIEAAKLLIKMLEEDGEPVDDMIRAVADAEPNSDPRQEGRP